MKSRLDKITSITYTSSRPEYATISSSNSNNKEFMKLVPREDCRNRSIVRMNLFGIDVDCCMATRNHPFFILCNQQDGEQMLQTIHNYFRGFFGSSIEYHLKAGGRNYIPRLKHIKHSIIVFQNESLDGYLTVSPSQEYIKLCALGGFGYERNLKLAETKVLDTMISDSSARDILNNFKGRHLFMMHGIVTDEDVIQFLNNWKSSQKHRNLEYLNINLRNGIGLNPGNIMRGFNIKQFDPNQKIPVYQCDKRDTFEQYSWKIEEFSSPNFIVREADQQVASLEITTRGIKFASWKMTEEEVMRGRIQKTFQKTPLQNADSIINPIKISKFSWLIQREILSSMELVDLLMMASCSQKFHRNIKSMMRSRFDKILTITYEPTPPSCINISSSSSGDKPFIRITSRLGHGVRPSMTNLCGMDLQVCMPTINHPLMIYYDPTQRQTGLPSIHNLFLDFFGSSIKYHLNGHILTPAFSKLKNISSTELTSDSTIGETEFHDFLKISPNQDFIGFAKFESPLLGRNLELARTKVLDIGKMNCSADDVLSYFEGRQLFIDNGIISDAVIIRFLNKWRSNEGYQNLEYFSISVSPSRHPLSPNQIMNSMPINRLNSSDRLPVYQFARKDYNWEPNWGIHEFSSPSYIVRDSDQHVASIMITDGNITFAAWNMTEKEFVETRPVKRFY